MFDDILRQPNCGVPKASDAYARLFDIVARYYKMYDEPRQAIILALAYAQYSGLKKDYIKTITEEILRPVDRTNQIRNAWKAISSEKQLKDYCEEANRLLTALLKRTQEEARGLVDAAVTERLDDLKNLLESIEENTSANGTSIDNQTQQLQGINATVGALEEARKDSQTRRAQLRQDLRLFKIFVTKPLESVAVSLVVFGTAILVAAGIHLFSDRAIAKVVAALQALATFLADGH